MSDSIRELSFKKISNSQYSNTKLYHIEQYTPHIHFQHNEDGACLRASEVKPKLDKFICNYLKHNNYISNEKKLPDGWVLKEENGRSPALNYKLSIVGQGLMDKPEWPKYSSYFGNMGVKDNHEKKECVYYKDGLTLTVSCPNNKTLSEGEDSKSLMDIIDYCLPAFFRFNCFGTRSTKGWGAYGVKNREVDENYLKHFVDAYYEIRIPNKMSTDNIPGANALEAIKTLSNMIKGGINFKGYYKGRIYCYFLEKKIRSDKAYMKNYLFENADKDTLSEYRYVRAMLGITDSIEFKDRERKGKVLISDSKGEIARFNNPVHFIPNANTIIILPTEINDALSGREFILTQGRRKGNLKTPNLKNGEFSLEEFLDWFMEQHNNKVDKVDAPDAVKKVMNQQIRKVGGSHV